MFLNTADGKVFPHECNGALINTAPRKRQQRLKGYKGHHTDNAEANTTQPIELCG